MGYYSEVVLTLYKDDFAELIKKAEMENEDAYLLIRSAALYYNEERAIITLHWYSIKWYEEWEEISFIENFMRSGIQYKFICSGEEIDDICEESNDDSWMLYERSYVIKTIHLDDVGREFTVGKYLSSIEPSLSEDKGTSEAETISENDLFKILDM